MTLRTVPATISSAKRFVGEHHRHNLPPVSGLFAVGVEYDGELVGVGIAGRPSARRLDSGSAVPTIEITRCCTLDDVERSRHAASKIYGRLCRAGAALGYEKAITYTTVSESGVSLRAAGFVPEAETPARSRWTTRPRYQTDLFGNDRRPTEAKIRWSRSLRP